MSSIHFSCVPNCSVCCKGSTGLLLPEALRLQNEVPMALGGRLIQQGGRAFKQSLIGQSSPSRQDSMLFKLPSGVESESRPWIILPSLATVVAWDAACPFLVGWECKLHGQQKPLACKALPHPIPVVDAGRVPQELVVNKMAKCPPDAKTRDKPIYWASKTGIAPEIEAEIRQYLSAAKSDIRVLAVAWRFGQLTLGYTGPTPGATVEESLWRWPAAFVALAAAVTGIWAPETAIGFIQAQMGVTEKALANARGYAQYVLHEAIRRAEPILHQLSAGEGRLIEAMTHASQEMRER